MGRIGLGELLILAFLVAGFVGLVFLVTLGVRNGFPAGAPFNCIRRPLGRGPTRRHELRWWDGQTWSPSVSDQGVLGHGVASCRAGSEDAASTRVNVS